MTSKQPTFAFSAVLSGVILSLSPPARADRPVDFRRDIRPLLSDRCMFCHGPDEEERQAELNFHDKESVFAKRDEAAVVVPRQPGKSALIHRIESTDPDVVMPPPDSGKSLTAEEKQMLRRWIEQGGEWSQHWAYEPPTVGRLPPATAWSKHPVDRFIADRHQQEQLSPNEDADPVTLLRRLHFDLTGLPPTREDVVDFKLADYETVVDKLLASDAYGERVAMLWLDLVRFADTVGYHGDQDHNVSPYRDWVVRAFADNMRFDDFTRAQLAGDLLPKSTLSDKIASCYNRLLQTSHEGGVQPKEYLAIYSADRVRNVSAVWMGATLGCAQCHDHKYDPYTAKDFYSMAAFFADIDEAKHFKVGTNSLPTRRPPEIDLLSDRDQREMDVLQQRLLAAGSNRKLRREIEKRIAAVRKRGRRCMITVATKPRVMRLLPRGNWLDDSGEIVQPAIPEFMGTVSSDSDRATRLDLANWLVDPDNGSGKLTARVMVNRFWYMLFGTGLAANLDDFGGQGEPPEHPELLDWLALDFARDWNVKRVVKTIVMSRAYRQSSTVSPETRKRDPDNRLFARQGSYRLSAEMVRDNALTVSGLLVHQVGGDSVKPYQPPGYYRHLNFPARKYKPHKDTRQWRRGLYVHWQRQFLHPMLKAFDAPTREECTAQRPRSNTPLAALVLLNDPTFVEAARNLAARVFADAENDIPRLNLMVTLTLSRKPTASESTILKRLLDESWQRFRHDEAAARELLSVGDSQAPLKNAAELAAWTQLARTIMNLDEFVTRN